jgi:beta-galactosidase
VNSEFYPGWLDLWGSPHSTVPISDILPTFYEMLDMGANVNFYMFHGGTNFGFSNGENLIKFFLPIALLFVILNTKFDYN